MDSNIRYGLPELASIRGHIPDLILKFVRLLWSEDRTFESSV